GCIQRSRAVTLVVPASALKTLPRALGVEVGNGDDVDTRCTPRLGEEHRAEFPGAYEQDAQRFSVGGTLGKQAMEVHGIVRAASRNATTTGFGTLPTGIGAPW